MKQLATASHELMKPGFQRICVAADWVSNCITLRL